MDNNGQLVQLWDVYQAFVAKPRNGGNGRMTMPRHHVAARLGPHDQDTAARQKNAPRLCVWLLNTALSGTTLPSTSQNHNRHVVAL